MNFVLTPDSVQRMLRTAWQGFGLDALVAVASIIAVSGGQLSTSSGWKIVGLSAGKTVASIIASWVHSRIRPATGADPYSLFFQLFSAMNQSGLTAAQRSPRVVQWPPNTGYAVPVAAGAGKSGPAPDTPQGVFVGSSLDDPSL